MADTRTDPETRTPASSEAPPVVVFDDVSFAFDDQVVLQNVSFTVEAGDMRFLLGASGSGKSVLLKLVLGLDRPDSGTVSVNGHLLNEMRERDLLGLRADIGMVFQENALFDSLTVDENVGYRLYEETKMPIAEVRERVLEVLGFVGLAEFISRMPSELSGGQRRRVALARAMTTRPGLLLFDDPTTGLDPITAATVDDEIVKLRDLEQVTTIVATHQMRDAFHIAQHRAVRTDDGFQIVEAGDTPTATTGFMVLHEGRICFDGSADELLASEDPYIKEFLYNTLPPW